VAEDARQWKVRIRPAGDMQVGVADAGPVDADHHLVALDSGEWNVLEDEGLTELVESGSLHRAATVTSFHHEGPRPM
jgi:hypothetical protein